MFDETETIDGNPKSWVAWKREAERLQKIIDEMTTNHPVHGPVSLERLHQIRETLSKAAAQSDGGNIGYAMADAVKVIDGAIASFGTEPVAWLLSGGGAKNHVSFDSGNAYSDPLREVTPLYAAPQLPQPAVGELTAETLPDEIKQMPAATAFVWMDGWNKACRAAMLQGADPERWWIPCSERMPEKLLPVMVMYEDGEMWSAIWTGTKWDDGTEVPDPHAVTHWQEMPAAPQQEVKK